MQTCMHILYSGSLDVTTGGPAMSTYLTMKGLQKRGHRPEIVQYPLSEGGRLRGEDVTVHFAKAPLVPKIAYSPSLRREIRALGEFDIYHAQGIWQYPTYALLDEARRAGKPYLVSPRGMLYPQDIAKRSTLFKKLSLRWRLLRDLNNAACVHCTCLEEMYHCRNLGVTAPIAVITNPVELKELPFKKEDDVRRIGYLGRVSPRKKVERLIYAFAELADTAKDAELLIIGGGDAEYEAFLKSEVRRLGLENVRFTGFLCGEEKDRAIASCSVLVNPSDFENLGMVTLEGLVRGIPCIATYGAPWEKLAKMNCGWWVPASRRFITDAIAAAIRATDQQLHEMGERGKDLAAQYYSLDYVSLQMDQLYKWVLGKGSKPRFVYDK